MLQFKLNAQLSGIANLTRANKKISFISADLLTGEFKALLSKRVTLLVLESNGHPVQETLPLPDDAEPKPEPQLIVVPGQPIGKPRQTAADRWKQRPCVLRYRAFADRARLAANGKMPKELEAVTCRFYFAMPESWPEKKRLQHDGQHHYDKPDLDNCIKAVLDSLLENDQIIAKIEAEKFWTNGEPRTEVIFSK